MTKDINDIIENYLDVYGDLPYIKIAEKIKEDGALNMSVRTLRRYVAEAAQTFNTRTATEYPLTTEESFELEPGEESLDLDSDASAPPALPVAKRQPKILMLDIETARMIIGAWHIGKTSYIGPEQVIKEWFIFGWSAKWIYSPFVMSDFTTSEEAINRDDSRLCKSIWKLMEEADIIVTHNGDKFDIPKINSRFLLHGLPPVAPFRSVDTCKVARKHFGMSSNKMDYIAKINLNRSKIKTDYQLWIDCENGVQSALDEMRKYCIGDVSLLEEVYVLLLPWIKSHPNLAVYMDTDFPCCPNCGGFDLEPVGSYYTTEQNAYHSVRCTSCGAVSRTRITNVTKEQRANMIVPTAR